MELEGLGILNMDSGLMLSVADLRSQAIVDWEQDVHLSFHYKRAAPMKIKVEPELVVPKAVFKYELHQALVEGTSNGGVRWWCDKVDFPSGREREHPFDISIRFMCRHGRKQYQKQVSTNLRRSKHTTCVDCPAFIRFRGQKCDDLSVAVVLTCRFEHPLRDPLDELRKKFQGLRTCIFAEILSSHQFVFMFQSACQADDAVHDFTMIEDHRVFQFEEKGYGKLRAVLQERYIFTVWKMNSRHERHLKPSHPAHRGMFMSYEVTQEVADMAAAGATPAAIINYLTRSGQRGLISAQRVHNIRATIQSDMSQFTVLPSIHESACQALLKMLDTRYREKKDLKYIYLYTEPSEQMLRAITDGDENAVEFQSIRMHTGHGEDEGLSSGDAQPEKSSWVASLIHFFTDRFSRLSGGVRIPPSREHAPQKKRATHGFQTIAS